eukprot:TRINITY_DN32903_c0_g1_i1.p1 TRINITY_DN32903_c0_g1~~TRINITY_DN32903_c0_g1_i1.p1  ORF type:complete len:391 (+),score=63.68 TRINITY_DN32903_c0_g1_i1:54-1175(+)
MAPRDSLALSESPQFSTRNTFSKSSESVINASMSRLNMWNSWNFCLVVLFFLGVIIPKSTAEPSLRGAPNNELKFFEAPKGGQLLIPDNVENISHVYCFLEEQDSSFESKRKAIEDAAERMRDKPVAFFFVPSYHSNFFGFFLLKSAHLPMLAAVSWPHGVVHHPYDMFQMKLDDSVEMSADAVVQFATSFLAGELTPTRISEPILEESGKHDMRMGAMQIVGSQWQDLVISPDVDVVVAFLAPWCGFSKRAAPNFDKLAKHLRYVPTISMYKIDPERNDIHDKIMDQATGWPFFVLFPAGAKDKPQKLEWAKHFGAPTVVVNDEWLEARVAELRSLARHPIPDPVPTLANNSAVSSEEDSGLSQLDRDIEEI